MVDSPTRLPIDLVQLQLHAATYDVCFHLATLLSILSMSGSSCPALSLLMLTVQPTLRRCICTVYGHGEFLMVFPCAAPTQGGLQRGQVKYIHHGTVYHNLTPSLSL